MSKQKISIFWHRRDLRIEDNHGLYRALTEKENVLPVFIFDRNILDELEDKNDRRVTFIYKCVSKLREEYQKSGGDLAVFYSDPEAAFRQLTDDFEVDAVYTNKDYEPYARKRDKRIMDLLSERGADFKRFKDQVIFEEKEILKDNGEPYSVYTPYSKKWSAACEDKHFRGYGSENELGTLADVPNNYELPSLENMGFVENNTHTPKADLDEDLLRSYAENRNLPAVNGTARVSHHLRFGTLSIRHLVRLGKEYSDKWLNELIWREFYMMILYHHPRVVTRSFRPKYDQIDWRNNKEEFEKWCTGNTGYPIVDAGMRELNQTGFMHNRVRMITASFLTKHLLIHWSWGEAYFARKLLDYELSSNNGGWQWAAGSGCDAAPYFRVFNPELQMKRYDPELKYIKKYVPEYDRPEYVRSEIVPHKKARERALERYKVVLKSRA